VNVTLCDGETGFSWEAPDNSTGTIPSILRVELDLTGAVEGILACPVTSSTPNTTVQYQVYARTSAFNETGCFELEGLVPQVNVENAFGAWQ